MSFPPSIDKETFEREYAERSGLTVERLREIGLFPIPCDCDWEECQGWQMTTKERLVGVPGVAGRAEGQG